MAETTVVIPSDVDAALVERAAIYAEYDQASATYSKIEELRDKFGSPIDSSPTADPLTAQGLPPAELAAVLKGLEDELSGIKEAEASIAYHEAEIRAHIKRRNTMILIGVVVLIILLFILFSSVS